MTGDIILSRTIHIQWVPFQEKNDTELKITYDKDVPYAATRGPSSTPQKSLHSKNCPLEGIHTPELENEALCRRFIVSVSSGACYTEYSM